MLYFCNLLEIVYNMSLSDTFFLLNLVPFAQVHQNKMLVATLPK
jgi:hypothetical protein